MPRNPVVVIILTITILIFYKNSLGQTEPIAGISVTTPKQSDSYHQIYSDTTPLYYISPADKRAVISLGMRQGFSQVGMYGSGADYRQSMGARLEERIGYDAAVELRFDIYRYMHGSIGVGYTQRSAVLDGWSAPTYGPISMNYITVPLATGASLLRTRVISLTVEGGISFNYRVSSQNPYADHGPEWGRVNNYNMTASAFYGAELSTDIIRRVNIFVSYRKFGDLGPFHGSSDYSVNRDDDYIWQGKTVSLGVRIKRQHRTREQRISRGKLKEDSPNDNFQWGAKAGVNLNNTMYDGLPVGKTDDSRNALGGHVGFFARIKLGEKWSFAPELQYILKGYSYNNNFAQKRTIYLHYVEQPFLLSYSLSRKLSIEAGPVVGMFLDAKMDGTSAESRASWYAEYLEFGLTGGARYKLSETFSLGARYFQGLKSIADIYYNTNVFVGNTTKEYNTNLQLSGFINF